MGQCFPLPEDENLKEGMLEHARNYERIYNMYNFDVEPPPGSDMAKAQALWDKKEVGARNKRTAGQPAGAGLLGSAWCVLSMTVCRPPLGSGAL